MLSFDVYTWFDVFVRDRLNDSAVLPPLSTLQVEIEKLERVESLRRLAILTRLKLEVSKLFAITLTAMVRFVCADHDCAPREGRKPDSTKSYPVWSEHNEAPEAVKIEDALANSLAPYTADQNCETCVFV